MRTLHVEAQQVKDTRGTFKRIVSRVTFIDRRNPKENALVNCISRRKLQHRRYNDRWVTVHGDWLRELEREDEWNNHLRLSIRRVILDDPKANDLSWMIGWERDAEAKRERRSIESFDDSSSSIWNNWLDEEEEEEEKRGERSKDKGSSNHSGSLMIEGLEERTKARDERGGKGVKMRQARRTFREMKQEGWAILPTVRVSSFSYWK